MTEDVEIARQWVAKARNDLLSADNNLRAEEIPFDAVCFHCQQAAEKLLKAFLITQGVQPPFTHDLFLLLEEIIPFNSSAKELKEALALLNPFSVEIRYPDDWFMPSLADAKEARASAGRVMEWIRKILPDIFV